MEQVRDEHIPAIFTNSVVGVVYHPSAILLINNHAATLLQEPESSTGRLSWWSTDLRDPSMYALHKSAA